MRKTQLLSLLLLGIIPRFAWADEDIGPLIEQLGHSRYSHRQAASNALARCPVAALPRLRQARIAASDEVGQRIDQIIALLEQRSHNSRVLAAPRVCLQYSDTPIAKALADAAYKLKLELHISPQVVTDRTVTLDTGKVPIWQALEQLCRVAGLRIDRVTSAEEASVSGSLIRLYLVPADSEPAVSDNRSTIRVQQVRPSAPAPTAGWRPLHLLAIPAGMHSQGIVNVSILRACDENARPIAVTFDPRVEPNAMASTHGPGVNMSSVHIPLRMPGKAVPGNKLARLEGIVTLRIVYGEQDLLAVDNLAQPAGRDRVQDLRGYSLEVLECCRQVAGKVKLRLHLQSPTGAPTEAVHRPNLLLLDGNGEPLTQLDLRSESGRTQDRVYAKVEVTYQLPKGSEPGRLVWRGVSSAVVDVPFELSDVVLYDN